MNERVAAISRPKGSEFGELSLAPYFFFHEIIAFLAIFYRFFQNALKLSLKKIVIFFNILVTKNVFLIRFSRKFDFRGLRPPRIGLGLQGNVTGNITKVNENNQTF